MWSSSRPQAPSGVVREKVFQARLRDVDVAKLGAQHRSYVHDSRNQWPSPIRVQIDRLAISPHFGYAGQFAQALDEFWRGLMETQAQEITAGDRSLELGRSAAGDHTP